MELAAAKRMFTGLFLTHLLLAAQLAAAGKTQQLS
jgi:hypothetical protein